MKGFRFYAAMPESRGSKSASKAHPFDPWTVARLKAKARATTAKPYRCDLVAVPLDDYGRPGWQGATQNMDAIATAIEGNPLSYCYGGVSREWLAKRCTRIPEDLARQLSPELFTYLES